MISFNRFGSYDIYRVDVPSGDVQRLTSDSNYEVYGAFSADGRDIFYVCLDQRWVDHEIIRMGRDGSNPLVVGTDENFFDYHYGRTFGYPTASRDGKQVFFRSHRSGWINYWAIPPDGGDPRQLVPEDADPEGGSWSPDGKSFAYTSNSNGTIELRVVPSEDGPSRQLFSPGIGVCSFPQWSRDGTEISFLHATPTRPADLHVVRVSDGAVRQLTDSTIGQTESMLAKPEKITFPSFDGETISTYLFRPKSVGVAVNGAAVVWVHGGPTSQFSDTLQLQVQYSSSAGTSCCYRIRAAARGMEAASRT